jgi:Ca2+-binding RTX toxin-like protein
MSNSNDLPNTNLKDRVPGTNPNTAPPTVETIQSGYYTQSKGGWVMGTSGGDTFNADDLLTDREALGGATGTFAAITPGAGDDNVTGTDGFDRLDAGPGDDVYHGRGGNDNIDFVLAETSGAGELTKVVAADGSLQLKLDGVTVLTGAWQTDGAFLVTGVTGTAGGTFGTERLYDVASMTVHADHFKYLNFQIPQPATAGGTGTGTGTPGTGTGTPGTGSGTPVPTPTQGEAVTFGYYTQSKGGWVMGTSGGDTFDASALLTDREALGGATGTFAAITPGAGNDNVTGTDGFDRLDAGPGDDVFHGRGGNDNIDFVLAETSGAGELTKVVAADGSLQLKLDGVTVLTGAWQTDGAFLVTGVTGTAGGMFGTERLYDVASMTVHADHFKYLNFQIPKPATDGTTADRPNAPTSGNDTLTGTADNDVFSASPGSDAIDGGLGLDTLQFLLPATVTGTPSQARAGNGDVLIQLGGETIVTIALLADGGYVATGMPGTVAGSFGSETLHNVESVLVRGSGLSTAWYVDLDKTFAAVLPGSAGSPTLNRKLSNTTTGDDTLTGGAGNDVILASAGNDLIDGGAGNDTVRFELPTDTSGALSYATAGAEVLLKLNGATILTLSGQADGSVLATGTPGTVGAMFGTEMMRNVESVLIGAPSLPSYWHVDLAQNFSIGSAGETRSQSGTSGSDYFYSTRANDTLDGLAGRDTYVLKLTGVSGPATSGYDAAGNPAVLVNGQAVASLAHQADGSVTVIGIAGTPGAVLGTDTLRNIEQITVHTDDYSAIVQLGAFTSGNVAYGTPWDDTLDLGALFPAAAGGKLSARPEQGNDTIIGSSGNDTVWASGGNDTFNGGAGNDALYLHFGATLAGTLAVTNSADGHSQITNNGTVIFDIVHNADGSFVMTGMAGTAGAQYGTETLRDVELIQVLNNSSYVFVDLTHVALIGATPPLPPGTI